MCAAHCLTHSACHAPHSPTAAGTSAHVGMLHPAPHTPSQTMSLQPHRTCARMPEMRTSRSSSRLPRPTACTPSSGATPQSTLPTPPPPVPSAPPPGQSECPSPSAPLGPSLPAAPSSTASLPLSLPPAPASSSGSAVLRPRSSQPVSCTCAPSDTRTQASPPQDATLQPRAISCFGRMGEQRGFARIGCKREGEGGGRMVLGRPIMKAVAWAGRGRAQFSACVAHQGWFLIQNSNA